MTNIDFQSCLHDICNQLNQDINNREFPANNDSYSPCAPRENEQKCKSPIKILQDIAFHSHYRFDDFFDSNVAPNSSSHQSTSRPNRQLECPLGKNKIHALRYIHLKIKNEIR